MANINSLMSNTASGTTNLYGTRNVLSGLASGMDTESMIENSVSGYKTKITQLEKEQTKYQWKQDAYRSITDKMYDLTQKYTSYTSKTNLASNAIFTNSIATTPVGPADAISKVSATGRSSSDIQILAAQAATAATYSVSAASLGLKASQTSTSGLNVLTAQKASEDTVPVGKIKGSMTLDYDGQKIEISFDETDLIDNRHADERLAGSKSLVETIRDKLSDVTINTKFGAKKASEVINVDKAGAEILFSENSSVNKQGAKPYVSYVDANLQRTLGATQDVLYKGSSTKTYALASPQGSLVDSTRTVAQYLSEKEINVTVDGVTKSFTLNVNGDGNGGDVKKALQKGIESLGMGIKAEIDANGELSFSSENPTSNFSINTDDKKAGELLGFGDGLSNFIDSKATIGNLLGTSFASAFTRTKESDPAITGRLEEDGAFFLDKTTGNRYEKVTRVVNQDPEETVDEYFRVDAKGKALYELTINDKSVYVSEDSTLDSVVDSINNSDMGVKASYSKLTGNFVFTSKETGANSKIEFGNNLAQKLFGSTSPSLSALIPENAPIPDKVDINFTYGSLNIRFATMDSNTDMQMLQNSIKNMNGPASYAITNPADGSVLATFTKDDITRLTQSGAYTRGTDATVRTLVNGELKTLVRSSNTIELDGMKVTLNGSFNDEILKDSDGNILALDQQPAYDPNTEKANAISFTTSGGSDDLLKTITSFVDDYNAILKEVHDAYATQPAEKNSSTHTKYEPLTDDDKSGMSDKAVESYEAKAKQGILFGDSDLRALYETMVRNISPGGNDGAALRDMGIDVTYSGGLTQIKLNETKLRDALAKDPDSVRNAFTKSKEYGATSDGLMTSIKKTMDNYASTSVATPGILVKKAGSAHSSASLLKNAMQTQIDNVQKKIEQWQTKMSSKIDYYTRQFTTLEKLMNTMNSQSSALAGLMGGY